MTKNIKGNRHIGKWKVIQHVASHNSLIQQKHTEEERVFRDMINHLLVFAHCIFVKKVVIGDVQNHPRSLHHFH